MNTPSISVGHDLENGSLPVMLVVGDMRYFLSARDAEVLAHMLITAAGLCYPPPGPEYKPVRNDE